MKNIKHIIYILILTIISFGLNAQDNRTTETKVADILNVMPAANIDQLDKAMREMTGLSDSGFAILFRHLQNEKSSDLWQKSAYAIESYARFISTVNETNVVNAFNKRVFYWINGSGNVQTMDFLLATLQYTFNQNSIEDLKIVAQYEQFQFRVINLLVIDNSKKSLEFLLHLYQQATGSNRIPLLKALTETGITSQVSALIKELNSTKDQEFIIVAHNYLANSGSAQAWDYFKSKIDQKKPDSHTDTDRILPSVISLHKAAYQAQNPELARGIRKYVKEKFKAENYSSFLSALSSTSLLHEEIGNDQPKSFLNEFKKGDMNYHLHLLGLAAENKINVPTKILSNLYKSGNIDQRRKVLEFLKQANSTEAEADFDKIVKREAGHPLDSWYDILLRRDLEGTTEKMFEVLLHEEFDILPQFLSAWTWNMSKNLSATLLQNLLSSSELSDDNKAAILRISGPSLDDNSKEEVLHIALSGNEKLKKTALDIYCSIATVEDIEKVSGLLKTEGAIYKDILTQGLSRLINELETEEEKYAAYMNISDQIAEKEVVFSLASKIGGYTVLQDILKYAAIEEYQKQVDECLINWSDQHAIYPLFKRLNGTANQEMFFEAILRLIQTDLSEAQRLLHLKNLMDQAENNKSKIKIIQALATIKSYPAYQYTRILIDYIDLEQAAARALVSQILPGPDSDLGLYGQDVKNTLLLITQNLSGWDKSYLLADIEEYLNKMPDAEGFTSMFNGENLEGWKGFIGSPLEREKMSDKTKHEKQRKANEGLSKNWRVENGQIVFNGKGANLVSVKDYGDFEMYVDWKITRRGDSGIYLRGTPQVQIWDTSRVEVGAQVGSGGLYNNQKNPSKPLVVADNPVGEWNTFYIKMIDEKVTVYLNGILVVDDVILENYWDRKQTIFPSGPIELQAHGTDLAFRDIFIREISSPDMGLSIREKSEGFESLFNGKDLDKWTGNKQDYQVKNTVIELNPKGGGHGNLYTSKEYSNFNFRFEFQLTPGANNGLGIHAPLKGDAAYVGKELQILDNTADIYADLKDWQYHGSIYGVVPAKRGFLKPVGEWNQQEVIVQGNRIKIILNGTVIVDADYEEASRNGTIDGKKHPGLKRKTGHIGFLGHGSVVRFRNIRVKEL